MLHFRRAASTACAGLSALLWQTHATAQTPTAVEVRFELTDPKFRTKFGAGAADLEKKIATMMAEQLGARLGFVRFVAGQNADHRVVFSLDRQERTSSGRFDERGLWAKLTLPDSSHTEIYWLRVRRGEEATLPVGSADVFQEELRLLLIHADLELLKTKLLARVPIATRALVWSTPLGWALPFLHSQLCMKNRTELMIVNELPSGNVRLELPFQASAIGKFTSSTQEQAPFDQRIFTTPTASEPEQLNALRNALRGGQVKVLGVYVTKYERDESVCRNAPLPPTTSGPGGGAQ